MAAICIISAFFGIISLVTEDYELAGFWFPIFLLFLTIKVLFVIMSNRPDTSKVAKDDVPSYYKLIMNHIRCNDNLPNNYKINKRKLGVYEVYEITFSGTKYLGLHTCNPKEVEGYKEISKCHTRLDPYRRWNNFHKSYIVFGANDSTVSEIMEFSGIKDRLLSIISNNNMRRN